MYISFFYFPTFRTHYN